MFMILFDIYLVLITPKFVENFCNTFAMCLYSLSYSQVSASDLKIGHP